MAANVELKGKVCVTGASGFLASWLIKRLLLCGYQVIGTVRDPENAKKVEHLWRLEGAKERLMVVKGDLMKEGSFDEAIMGCEGVFHTASPVLGRPTSNPKEEILEPAIEGTLNVLRSCNKNGALRRVVMTSSSSTVRARSDLDPNDEDLVLDESSWSCEQLCERLKMWYVLSKTRAEKAAWKFCNENKIDLVTVLPSFVVGPSLPRELSTTVADVLSLLKGETDKFEWHGRMGYVHIEDVAECHILVYERKEARGRYLCSSTVVDNHELASILSTCYPGLPIPTSFNNKLHHPPSYDLNTCKLKGLGFRNFRSIPEMFHDCIKSLVQQGHLSLSPQPSL